MVGLGQLKEIEQAVGRWALFANAHGVYHF